MTEPGVFEAIHTARALRRLKPDPVPEELITRILDAAIRAPSAGNAQNFLRVHLDALGDRAEVVAMIAAVGPHSFAGLSSECLESPRRDVRSEPIERTISLSPAHLVNDVPSCLMQTVGVVYKQAPPMCIA